MKTMFEICAQNFDDYDDSKVTYFNEELMPSRTILVEYIRKALTITWTDAGKIEKVLFAPLSPEDEEELWRQYKEVMLKLKLQSLAS